MKLKLLILLCNKDSAIQRAIKKIIPAGTILLENDIGPQGLQLLANTAPGVVLVDTSEQEVLPWMEEALRLRPDLTYLAIVHGKDIDAALYRYFYDFIYWPLDSGQVNASLERAWERFQLRLQLENFKESTLHHAVREAAHRSLPSRPMEHLLCEFSRALGSNFNRDRLLELFMDAVTELVPVGKLSILLYHGGRGEYLIAAQRGLDPHYCAGIRFPRSAALISWLVAEGRILRCGETVSETAFSARVRQETRVLFADVCIPLMAYGKLVGTLNLGPKVTGSPFANGELEMLYILCGNVALALHDIDLHHHICYQKAYIESILEHMNSGVIAINRENRIITFNNRAGKILGLKSEEAMQEDIRFLPSPLGDLLYETLSTGKIYDKEEVLLARGRLPLEFSIYRLFDEQQKVVGSVLIFDDISERKQLEAERRQADQLDVLNKFVGQLAHEIKNPMVAIQTFCELLPEKYDDSSFREFFTHTVRLEVKRLNELVEQLIAFSATLSYKFAAVEIHEILDKGLLLLQEQGKGQKTAVQTSYCRERLNVKADKTMLARAFAYLLRNSFEAVEKGGNLYIETSYQDVLFGQGGICISFWDFQTRAGSKDPEKLFDPLYIRQEGYISLELPVSRKIIEDHGGSVKASLMKDNYLKFEVLLPYFSGEGGENVAE